MTLSTTEKQKMILAKELITKKRYREAYALIESVSHPKAVEWRKRLKVYIDEQEFDELFEPNPTLSKRNNANQKASKNKHNMYVGIGIVVVIGLVLLAMQAVTKKFTDDFKANLAEPTSAASTYSGDQWMYWNDSSGNYYLATYDILEYSPTSSSRKIGGHTLDMASLVIRCNSGKYDISVLSATKPNARTDTYSSSLDYDFYRTSYNADFELTDEGDLVVVGFSTKYLDSMMRRYLNEMKQSETLTIWIPLLGIYEDMPTLGFNIRGFVNAVKPLENNCGALGE